MDDFQEDNAPKKFPASLVSDLQNFIKQSERVINVTHKPQPEEYRHIASSTALGLAVIGVIGFIIAMVSHYLRTGL
ncbi:MAG TPA: protein translocase SEC61 complex subunit gamma [Candidatus Norongarragalinales archaeon]|jgi:protein transport protein SEC61 subunit gamma-like protein|nr:protein translocase SEC61 complex subunit gamma [Candidatus Norongarragalinales archaeon]